MPIYHDLLLFWYFSTTTKISKNSNIFFKLISNLSRHFWQFKEHDHQENAEWSDQRHFKTCYETLLPRHDLGRDFRFLIFWSFGPFYFSTFEYSNSDLTKPAPNLMKVCYLYYRALVRILKVLARKIFLLMEIFENPRKKFFCHVPLKNY